MTIIPAIDIIEGKAVRLEQGDFMRMKVYHNDPTELARKFEDAGLTRLHLVDLDGARTGRVRNWKVLEKIAGRTSLLVDFGGGIKSEDDVKIIFNSGAALAAIGSIAVTDEDEFTRWITYYGASKFLLGADVKNEKIAIHGWQQDTNVWVYDILQKYIAKGIEQIFCTDISRDGLLTGPGVTLYKKILARINKIHLIASGGISKMQDLDELKECGCAGAIIGKAIYENKITIRQLQLWMQ